METMLVVTISLSVLSLAIYWLGIYQKSKAASVVAYDVVEIVTAIDRRIFIDGYDSSKWGTLKYSNNNDVRKFLNEKLISSEADGRSLAGTGYLDTVHAGVVLYKTGDKGGEAKHKLTVDELPSHSHTRPVIDQICTACHYNLGLAKIVVDQVIGFQI